jgi:hypothetical protein
MLVMQGAKDNVLLMYAIHELDAALAKILAQTEPTLAWDEGWAFYYGTAEGCGPYKTAESRAVDFGTMDGSISSVNNLVEVQFTAGQLAASGGDYAATKAARDEIVRLLRVPYLQVRKLCKPLA